MKKHKQNLSLFLHTLNWWMYTLTQKGRNDKKEIYRPVSILPTLSNCFQKCMFSQVSAYFDEIFSNINMVLERVTVLKNVF